MAEEEMPATVEAQKPGKKIKSAVPEAISALSKIHLIMASLDKEDQNRVLTWLLSEFSSKAYIVPQYATSQFPPRLLDSIKVDV